MSAYNHLRLLITISLYLFSLPALACQCLWQGPFTKVQDKADLVISGEIIASKGNSMDLVVSEVLRGKEYREELRIWGDTGELCRVKVEDFPVGSKWVMALQRIDQLPDDAFNPHTPNVSFGRQGDYSLSNCGVYWLSLHEGMASGNIATAKRWQYRDDTKAPVLLSLIKAFLAGVLPEIALEEAEKPNEESKQLLNDTRFFLWQQRDDEAVE